MLPLSRPTDCRNCLRRTADCQAAASSMKPPPFKPLTECPYRIEP